MQRACESVAHCIARIVSVGHVTCDKKKPKPHLYVPIMAAGSQMPKDIEARIRAMPGNTTCVDCNNNAPQWASVTYGTLMCLEPWRQRKRSDLLKCKSDREVCKYGCIYIYMKDPRNRLRKNHSSRVLRARSAPANIEASASTFPSSAQFRWTPGRRSRLQPWRSLFPTLRKSVFLII